MNINPNIILEDDAVLLRGLQQSDFEYLLTFSLHEPDIWKYSLVRANGIENLENYIRIALEGRANLTEFPFIVFDKIKQEYAGSTRFYDINFDFKTLQLGYTWYGTNFQGTGLNKHCKFLLLEYAFETLGMDRSEMIDQLLSGKAKYSSIFNYPTLTWADIGAIGWLVDGAAIVNQTALAKCSYGPYARAMIRICKEENFHNKQGYQIMANMMSGTKEQQEMAQDALNRFWWPSLMMFGPNDGHSPNSVDLMKWKVKLYSNDDLRQRFIDRTVPQAEVIGLRIPDDKLKWNVETRHYEFGEIDWEEFNNVIKGNGPCNRLRMQQRNDAHTKGGWVRDAAAAYARKKEQRKAA